MSLCQAITDKQLWDRLVASRPAHTFLHSWDWGEFNRMMGDKVWRFGVFKSGHSRVIVGSSADDPTAVMQVIKVHARRGNFLFIPHGPILAEPSPPPSADGRVQLFQTLLEKICQLANREKVSFIRISPLLEDTHENRALFQQLGFRPAPIHMHAETTWTLDLTPSEDELLANMRKTTRNLVRRAVKEKVEIKMGDSDHDVEVFYRLYQETVKKHSFTPFALTFLKKQVKIIPGTYVFTAYHQSRPLASAIIVFYGNSAFYHHGASTSGKVPAAYLLQWEAIREAKRRGHKFYNFWGVIKKDAPANHPWQGITLFKTGFGGFQTDYLHAQDLPLSWRYWPNWLLETIRRKRRNL